jgi:23S rRNA pseudouridine1911/1915/1917 synthase
MMDSKDEPNQAQQELVMELTAEDVGKRLDAFLAERLPDVSRVRWRRAINDGRVKVNGRRSKAAYRIQGAETISAQPPETIVDGPQPEDIPLDVLFEDEHLAAINKPAGMVVHPAKGHWSGTLTSALAFHFQNLSSVGGASRPGIVHRLDRDTSGVIVVAKTDAAHLALARQFEQRTTTKQYLAIVSGSPDRDRDVISAPIGPHPYHRERMAIRTNHPASRDAESFYEVVERFRGFALVRVTPKTGRTHQIRIHLTHIGSPVLCDRLYGGRSELSVGQLLRTDDATPLLRRQALHARKLAIDHPQSAERLCFEAPLAPDIDATLQFMREHRGL